MPGGNAKCSRLRRAVVQEDRRLPGAENINDADRERCSFGKSSLKIIGSQRTTERAQCVLRTISRMSSGCGAIRISSPATQPNRRERPGDGRVFPETEECDDRDDGEEQPPGAKQCGVNGDDDERDCGEDALHCEETAISSISGS